MNSPHAHHARNAHHPHPARPGHGPAPEHETRYAELLDLNALVGAAVLQTALDAATDALGANPSSAVDLGAGSGTGSIAIATRFPGVRVHSLDAAATLLDRLRDAAVAAGVADRVEPHVADLDDDWPAVLPGAVDLAWAALSLHHVTDPARTLRQAFGALRPGGVLVVTEFTSATTFTPADLGTGRDGLGERIVSALAARGYPVTADWTDAIATAGFTGVQRLERTVIADAGTSDGSRLLTLQLGRDRERLADDLIADDVVALDAVIAALDTGTSGLRCSSGRAIWIAVRPEHDEAQG